MPRTNGETLLWHQDGLLNGRISEEKFKAEAIKFFGLTQEESCKSKQYFKKDIQEFINKHVNLQKSILREFLEENGGIGKHHETPPEDFKTEVQEEKQRRLAFLKFGREGMKSSRKYQEWLTQDYSIFSKTGTNIDGDKKRDFEDTNNQILLTRERSSGRNIFDAEKTVISKHQDGSIKKSVIKETFAKVSYFK